MSDRAGGADEPVVPVRAEDDRDTAWGDRDDGDRDDGDRDDDAGNDERLLRERPPHW